jgi:hypothetical protein
MPEGSSYFNQVQDYNLEKGIAPADLDHKEIKHGISNPSNGIRFGSEPKRDISCRQWRFAFVCQSNLLARTGGYGAADRRGI